MKTLIEKLKALRIYAVRCWLYFFCKHDWSIESNNRYDIMDNGKKAGEVTLNYLHCKKCGDYKVIPTDKVKNTTCT